MIAVLGHDSGPQAKREAAHGGFVKGRWWLIGVKIHSRVLVHLDALPRGVLQSRETAPDGLFSFFCGAR